MQKTPQPRELTGKRFCNNKNQDSLELQIQSSLRDGDVKDLVTAVCLVTALRIGFKLSSTPRDMVKIDLVSVEF